MPSGSGNLDGALGTFLAVDAEFGLESLAQGRTEIHGQEE
jgi:hypothetical protein